MPITVLMIGERTGEGWEIRLRSHGMGRYVAAAFLGFWLCGWAAGEAFALWTLYKGAMALLSGVAPDPGRDPLQAAPALMIGAFLLVWLALWTVGGVAALHQLLRLLWGEDRLTVSSGRLSVVHARGVLRTVRRYERESIRRISLVHGDRLALDTMRERIQLSALGSSAERIEAAAALTAELGLSAGATEDSPVLPGRWQEIITPEGERALVQNLSTRATQAKVAAVVTVLLAGLTLAIAPGALNGPGLLARALIVLAITLAAAVGFVWLARGRWEWRIGSGRLTLRKRYGASVRDVFEARRLVLDVSTDSDGDTWYELSALADADPLSSPAPVALRRPRPGSIRTIAKLMNDEPTVRNLGAWLAREAGLALDDRTTPAARQAELAQLRDLLEQSGRFGHWAAKVVDRLSEGEKKAM